MAQPDPKSKVPATKGKKIEENVVPDKRQYYWKDGKKFLISDAAYADGSPVKPYSPAPAKPTPRFGGNSNPGAVYTNDLANQLKGEEEKKKKAKGKLSPATFK